MHFKQIEMTGFKSFADRTIMHMETGTTAVVGPNGCGKSNILDAVRWALGEQSAKALRGGHMQDVIFNGSELRSATGMAEVTLTFDNADSALPLDFAEVQITRRVYRSGESEYLINKAPCRLRDVQELFMDTGIGTNAYSMIGQGKISMVLSSKPEDRRFLFEEAAGIIKYKSRKRVAMRKLDSAEANLVRLHDIIAEVERQMRSLKRQVNAAIRYRELSDQLKEYEIRAAWLKHTSLSERIADLRSKFADAQNEYEKDSAGMSQLEARHEELSLHKLEVDRVLHARRETVHEIDTEMERIEKQIALIRQQIEFSGEQQERAATERQMFEEQAVVREGEAEAVAEKAATTRSDIAAANQVLETKQAEHEGAARIVQDADRLLEEARARSVETMGLRAKAQTTVETLTVNITNLESQLQAIYERQQAGNTRNAELVALLEEKQRFESGKQDILARLEQERASAAEREMELGRQMQALHERWQGLRENKSSTDARLNSLRELRDSYEGFAAGVRASVAA
ncbi:MAG: AAA family ATPase, partial [Candidatus Hydrogenedentales bacterium]